MLEPLEIAEIFTFRKRVKGRRVSAGIFGCFTKIALQFWQLFTKELRNQFVFEIKYSRIQARLLETVDLTMDSAFKIACSMEKTDQDIYTSAEGRPRVVSGS